MEAGYPAIPRYFNEDQLIELNMNHEAKAFSDVKCVVCRGEGSYFYKGKRCVCPDDAYGHVAMRLVRWYWLHNIPLQYQKLDWEDWPTDSDIKAEAKRIADNFVNNWSSLRLNGVGLFIYGAELGTGKTWLATHVLKSLVKKGINGWFAPFFEVISNHNAPENRRLYYEDKLQSSALLVLDDVNYGYSAAQRELFSTKLEDVIRPRTNSNLSTIITTNMSIDEFSTEYPRIYSLLSAKNIFLELSGVDGRMLQMDKFLNAMNGESLPIT
ncbi:MAG: ATP-binding protein [Candidatus Nitrosotenuis sp.]